MSGYPYNNNPPQYPPPQNQIYPQMYNQVHAPPPEHMGHPSMAGFPNPSQAPQYPYQPGFAYPYPGQPAPLVPSHHPAAMSYPGMPPNSAVPSAPVYGYAAAPMVAPISPFSSSVEWIPATIADAIRLSNRAIVGGYEGYDGSALWVIRARFESELIPGKLAINHHAAYVPWGGKENPVKEFEVCCAPAEKVRWIESRGGAVPPNAIVAGNTSSGEPLYVGRAKEQGALTPGKVHPSHQNMYVSFGGQEIAHSVYEVLCAV